MKSTFHILVLAATIGQSMVLSGCFTLGVPEAMDLASAPLDRESDEESYYDAWIVRRDTADVFHGVLKEIGDSSLTLWDMDSFLHAGERDSLTVWDFPVSSIERISFLKNDAGINGITTGALVGLGMGSLVALGSAGGKDHTFGAFSENPSDVGIAIEIGSGMVGAAMGWLFGTMRTKCWIEGDYKAFRKYRPVLKRHLHAKPLGH